MEIPSAMQLLMRSAYRGTHVDSLEFRMAISKYLLTYHSSDKEKIMMMFLAFNMHHEMGDFLSAQVGNNRLCALLSRC